MRALVVEELKPLTDSVSQDAMGNVIAVKKGSGLGDSVLSGAYGMVSYKYDDAGVRPVEPGAGSISPYQGGYAVFMSTVTMNWP